MTGADPHFSGFTTRIAHRAGRIPGLGAP